MSYGQNTGTVKWFNNDKGYGFITPDIGGNDVFVHINDLESSGIGRVKDGERLSFEVEDSRGRTKAARLRKI
jgi:CspA family cold shock protein